MSECSLVSLFEPWLKPKQEYILSFGGATSLASDVAEREGFEPSRGF